MSAPALDEEWPEGELYSSPLGLFDFQVEGVVQSYLGRQKMVIYDTGTGKGHITMREAALLAEQGELTTCLVVCERNKVGEWREDFARFTRLTLVHTHGAGPEARRRRLDRHIARHGAMPQVIVTTYETAKADLVTQDKVPGRRGTTPGDGWLMEYLRPAASGVLVVYDEVAKLRNRSSATYKAHAYLLKELRKAEPGLRVLGLTATPISTGWEDAFNQFRLVAPDSMPLVKDFEAYFVKSRDIYGRAEYRSDRMGDFVSLCEPWMIRKRKTDPDVVDQFPAVMEQAQHVEMGADQSRLYDLVEALGVDEDGEWDPPEGLFTVLRQVAGHPQALLRSEGTLAQAVVETVGASEIRRIPSAKSEALVRYLEQVVLGQRDKAVVFTFFGQSVLPLLASELRAAGIRTHTYHGGMSGAAKEQSRREFRSDPEPCVFLSSDAGARGINLPEASYVVEYDSSYTHDLREQRVNRCSRIDGGKKLLTCLTLIVDETIEVAIVEKMLARNAQQDQIRGDMEVEEQEFISAIDRRKLLEVSRLSRRKVKR
jgi:SNF2 family DNA or RNA helicase